MRTLFLLTGLCFFAIALFAQKDGYAAREELNCIDYVSDAPLPISEIGTPSINSEIFISDDFTISDITINVNLTHTQIGDLNAQLTTANGTNILLFDRPGFPLSDFGCSGDNLLLSFNTNSANAASELEDSCNSSNTGPDIPGPPHAVAGDYQPIGNLAGLNNQSSNGSWSLQINDYEVADGGKLESWGITICYELEGSPPELITNTILPVSYNQEVTLTNSYLQATDNENAADELIYRLNSIPSEGNLRLNGQLLQIDDTFTQQNIDGGQLSYTHNGSNTLNDAFNFDLIDPAGFCVDDNVFLIEIITTNFIASIAQTSVIFCNGGNNGVIETIVEGGAPPYSYRLNGGPFQDDNVFNGLMAGSYSVIVEDQLGVIAGTNTVIINEPEVLTSNLTIDQDEITVNTAGGTPGYTYFLNGSIVQTDNVFTDLANGSYAVIVIDANGCLSTTETVEVSVNTLALNAVLSEDVSCFNENDAAISITATGGIPPLQYSLNGGMLQDNPVFENLSAGTYIPEVIDSEGFTRQTTAITVSNPAELNAELLVDMDVITVVAQGGTPPLRYQLDNTPSQESNVFEDVANGSHVVHVMDANGCELMLPIIVAFNTLAISATLTEELDCFNDENGIITVTVSGGTPPLQYRLNDSPLQDSPVFENLPAGTYIPEVIDSEGFTRQTTALTINNPAELTASVDLFQSNIIVNAIGGTPPLIYQLNNNVPQESNVFEDVANGVYVIRVMDVNNCEVVQLATIAVNTLAINAVLTEELDCYNDEDAIVTITASGGTPPLMYQLNDGNLQESPTFENLAAGTYLPQVIDDEGFTLLGPEIVIDNPHELTATIDVVFNTIAIMAEGGTPPLSYQLDEESLQSDPVFTDLDNGVYSLRVIDANECSVVLDASILVNDMIVTTEVLNEVSCHAFNDAVLSANVTGGTAPFLYSLNNGPFSSLPDFDTVGAGMYTITVQDANGFLRTSNMVIVEEPDSLIMNVVLEESNLTINASGGTAPFEYSVDNINWYTTSYFPGLADGIYQASVRDARECIQTEEVVIATTSSLLAAFQVVNNVSCYGEQDAGFSVLMKGGIPPYLYSINGMGFQESNVFDSLGTGTYSIVVQDQEGMILDTIYHLGEPPLLSLSLTVSGQSIIANAEGGTPAYSYQINGSVPQAQAVFDNLAGGEYEITVIDANGCISSQMASVLVDVFDLPYHDWDIKLYPNPNQGVFQLLLPETIPEKLQLYIYNTAGQMVYRQIENNLLSTDMLYFDLSTYPEGVYQIIITNGNKIGVVRFVKT